MSEPTATPSITSRFARSCSGAWTWIPARNSSPGSSDEDSSGLVDPDLLDGRIVEEALERAETGDGVLHLQRKLHGLDAKRLAGRERLAYRIGHGLLDRIANRVVIAHRIDAARANELANALLGDDAHLRVLRVENHGRTPYRRDVDAATSTQERRSVLLPLTVRRLATADPAPNPACG